MQGNSDLDGSQLIVSWNRYEQGLMKKHLMRCINSNDNYCFGDENEVKLLHYMLVKHGVLQQPRDYNNPDLNQLVNDIKGAIHTYLHKYTGNRNFPYASDYSINDDKETQFLTKFAMAILDTKKRQPFFPGGCKVNEGNQTNKNCYKIYFDSNGKDYITLAKVKLLSLATQLTRIGLNCKTTINRSDRMKAPANQGEILNQRNIHLIDTNNFLDFSVSNPVGNYIDMNKLGIGMDGVQYYVNLYRKLFDFALKKEKRDGISKTIWKIPEFVIPLGRAWGTKLNSYIFTALNQVLGERWGYSTKTKGKNNIGYYKNFIKVKVIDDGTNHNEVINNPKKYPNLRNLGIVNYKQHKPLFIDPKYEHYMIMAGDHFAFIGNEAMYNGVYGHNIPWSTNGNKYYRDDSLESANVKTDFFKFYGQGQGQPTGYTSGYPQTCDFHPNNGAWIMNPKRLIMPNHYLLHCNYLLDKIYQISSGKSASLQISKQVNSQNLLKQNTKNYQQKTIQTKNNNILMNNNNNKPKINQHKKNIELECFHPQVNKQQPKNNFPFPPQQQKYNNFLVPKGQNEAFNANNKNNYINNKPINHSLINHGQNISHNFNNQNNGDAWDPLPNNQNLYVTWNRWGQGLMKKHLLECVSGGDWSCFGNQNEVNELYSKLQKHGLVSENKTDTFSKVNAIKNAIKSNLKIMSDDITHINDNETEFLTKFAIAIQDTKFRTTFIPESAHAEQYGNTYYFKYGNNSVTLQKARLFTLATLLTRIGINRKTTASSIQNIRNAEKSGSKTYRINVIDTNNFLNCGYLKMSDLIKEGLNPQKYYENLYRTLFDFALARQKQTNGKRPRFLIPLTGYWDNIKKNGPVNTAIKNAVTTLMQEDRYKIIKVDILDYNKDNGSLFSNWNEYGEYLTSGSTRHVVDSENYEDYAILSGDHFVFVGNECMNNWHSYINTGSHEAFSMKTDFPFIYSSKNYGFAQNGYWQVQDKDLNMPTNYNLYLNYNNDKLIPIKNTGQTQAQNFGFGFGFGS